MYRNILLLYIVRLGFIHFNTATYERYLISQKGKAAAMYTYDNDRNESDRRRWNRIIQQDVRIVYMKLSC